jgi:hypothetical protein
VGTPITFSRRSASTASATRGSVAGRTRARAAREDIIVALGPGIAHRRADASIFDASGVRVDAFRGLWNNVETRFFFFGEKHEKG